MFKVEVVFYLRLTVTAKKLELSTHCVLLCCCVKCDILENESWNYFSFVSCSNNLCKIKYWGHFWWSEPAFRKFQGFTRPTSRSGKTEKVRDDFFTNCLSISEETEKMQKPEKLWNSKRGKCAEVLSELWSWRSPMCIKICFIKPKRGTIMKIIQNRSEQLSSSDSVCVQSPKGGACNTFSCFT